MNRFISLYSISALIDGIFTTLAFVLYIYFKADDIFEWLFVALLYGTCIAYLVLGYRIIKHTQKKSGIPIENIIIGYIAAAIKFLIVLLLAATLLYFFSNVTFKQFILFFGKLPFYLGLLAISIWLLSFTFNCVAFHFLRKEYTNVLNKEIDKIGNSF